MNELISFIRKRRRLPRITQGELAQKAAAGLRFVLDLEQGKETVCLDKVNAVLALFSHQVGSIPKVWDED